MRIWTTNELKSLIDEGLPLKTAQVGIKEAFLREALPHDIALLPLDEDYLDFLTEKKRKGLSNPVIFISSEPTMIQENLPSYNAIMIDLKRTGKAEVKNMLSFILRLQSEASRPSVPIPEETIAEEPKREKPVEDPEIIRKAIDYIIKDNISIIISFPILEAERPVTVRGSCKIKELGKNSLLLFRLRPITLLKGIKEGLSVKAVLPAKICYECNLNILKIEGESVLASIPDRLFIERRRFLRIEPSPERPVHLYILKHDEPTIPVQVTDISQRGIGFITGRDLNIKEIYPLTIVLPEGDVIVSYGVIRFRREDGENFRYGVELFIHPIDEDRVAEYVMKRELEIIQLLEEE